MKETPMCDQEAQAMKAMQAAQSHTNQAMMTGDASGALCGISAAPRRSVRIEAGDHEAFQRNVEFWRLDQVIATMVNSMVRDGISQFTITVT